MLRKRGLTIRAIVHGMSHLIGQVAVGTMADLAFWDFDSFGARPNMIVKGGVIAWAQVSQGIPKRTDTLDGRRERLHPHCSASDRQTDVGIPPIGRCPKLRRLGQPGLNR
jgi:hypothetical protein